MFVSDTHLPHLLPLHAYFDREWYAAELEHVPRPAWWPVAVAHELPRDGDFITFDHVDGPDLEEHHTGAVHKNSIGALWEKSEGHPLRWACGSCFTQTAWWARRWAERPASSAGRTGHDKYIHSIQSPSLLWVQADMLTALQSVIPTGPRSCRYVLRSVVWLSRFLRPIL